MFRFTHTHLMPYIDCTRVKRGSNNERGPVFRLMKAPHLLWLTPRYPESRPVGKKCVPPLFHKRPLTPPPTTPSPHCPAKVHPGQQSLHLSLFRVWSVSCRFAAQVTQKAAPRIGLFFKKQIYTGNKPNIGSWFANNSQAKFFFSFPLSKGHLSWWSDFFFSLFLTLKLIYQSPPLLDISKARRWFNPSTLANSFLIRCQLGARPKLVKLSRQLLKKIKRRREYKGHARFKGGRGDVTCLTRQDYSTKCRRTRSFEHLFEGYEPNRVFFFIAKPNYITRIFVLSFVLFFLDVVWQWGAAHCDPCWAQYRPWKGYYATAQYCPPLVLMAKQSVMWGFLVFFFFFFFIPLAVTLSTALWIRPTASQSSLKSWHTHLSVR